MLRFSTDPAVAERQMDALVFSLTTFGYIDGDFDEAEKGLILDTIRGLVERRAQSSLSRIFMTGAARSAAARTGEQRLASV